MLAFRLTIVACCLAFLTLSASPASAQADANLRLKCALLGGDLSEPAEILAYKRCLATATAPNAPAPPIDARGCLPGLAHRRATPDDIVCVAPSRTGAVKLESLAAIARATPGSDRCQQGFVWRAATLNDHACVTPAERKLTADENVRALDRFAYASATSQNLCAFLDPAKIGRDLGLAEPPQPHSTNAGDCDVMFPTARAFVEINLVPRAQFGFGESGSKAILINGLGEKAVYDDRAGSDGLTTQRLSVLVADSALTIAVNRASMPNPKWGVAEAATILLGIAAQQAKLP